VVAMRTISAKVDDELYEKVKKVADENNITISTLLKQAFQNSTIKDVSVEREILFQIHKIGINLNQIAKRCNAKKTVDRLTLEALSRIENELKELL
jgi:predicted transcriptional regulator